MEGSSGKKEGKNRGTPSCVHNRRRWKFGQSLWLQFASVTLNFFYQHHHLLLQTVATLQPWLAFYTKVYSQSPAFESSIFISPIFISIIIVCTSHHSALDSTSSGPLIINSKVLNGPVALLSPRRLHGLLRRAYFTKRAQISPPVPPVLTTSTVGTPWRIQETMHNSHHVRAKLIRRNNYCAARVSHRIQVRKNKRGNAKTYRIPHRSPDIKFFTSSV